VRIDWLTGAGAPLIFLAQNGMQNAAAVAQENLDLMESLSEDTAEAFLYGFTGKGAGYRLLGARFCTDATLSIDCKGQLYDIYETLGPSLVASKSVRRKLYYFDGRTRLLAKTQYNVRRGSTPVSVSTEFSNWAGQAGQAFPGQIVRKENGTAVFTLSISKAAVGPLVQDALFPAP
jgi:hypothetical protein